VFGGSAWSGRCEWEALGHAILQEVAASPLMFDDRAACAESMNFHAKYTYNDLTLPTSLGQTSAHPSSTSRISSSSSVESFLSTL
jgi:hypothetical protein